MQSSEQRGGKGYKSEAAVHLQDAPKLIIDVVPCREGEIMADKPLFRSAPSSKLFFSILRETTMIYRYNEHR
jgi:hypothetical protein